MFSVPLKERQQGDISNYYIITISHNGHTECIRFCEPLFFQNYSIAYVYVYNK